MEQNGQLVFLYSAQKITQPVTYLSSTCLNPATCTMHAKSAAWLPMMSIRKEDPRTYGRTSQASIAKVIQCSANYSCGSIYMPHTVEPKAPTDRMKIVYRQNSYLLQFAPSPV